MRIINGIYGKNFCGEELVRVSNKKRFNQNINALKEIDIRTVDRKDLVDLNSVVINTERSVPERINDFIEQIQNPYCFKVGDVVVKIIYKEDGPTFQQNFEEMLLMM